MGSARRSTTRAARRRAPVRRRRTPEEAREEILAAAQRRLALISGALRPVDPSSAQVVEEIIADERRHVRYAEAITRRYAPDDVTLRRALGESRRIEARACAEHALRFTRFALQRDLLQLGLLERLGWTTLAALTLPLQPA